MIYVKDIIELARKKLPPLGKLDVEQFPVKVYYPAKPVGTILQQTIKVVFRQKKGAWEYKYAEIISA